MTKKIILSGVVAIIIFLGGFSSGVVVEKNHMKSSDTTINTVSDNVAKSSSFVGTWKNSGTDTILTISQDSKDTFTIKVMDDTIVGTYKNGIIVGELIGYKFVYKLDEKGILTVDGTDGAGKYTKIK